MNQDIYVVIEHVRGQVAGISYAMLAAAHDLARFTGGGVVGVLCGHNVQTLAGNLAADRVLYIDNPALAEFNPDAYLRALVHLIEQAKPRAVVLGSTTIGSDLAGHLSERLGMPLVSSCLKIEEAGKLVSKICGGKILAEVQFPDSAVLITMIPGGYRVEDGQAATSPELIEVAAPSLEDLRVTLSRFIEPDVSDVDISREGVLVAIGRGIQNRDNIELAEELAKALGGEVCASRPVIDQGWLPATRLVGRSGKTVKPKIYLAMGISGAPEHVESIGDSEMVIAVNTDPAAPIFGFARYGVDVDLFDLIEILTEEVEAAKSV